MEASDIQLRVGFEIGLSVAQDTPLLLLGSVHDSRSADMVVPYRLSAHPTIPQKISSDLFGNTCHRLIAQRGYITVSADGIVKDSGKPDEVVPDAMQHSVNDLPADALTFLLGSRYCETDLLSPIAWDLFGAVQPGWARVQAICDYVHRRIAFDYQQASSTRTALQAHEARVGVCRDYAHLATAFCRCMNIPARFCAGYLSDLGTPEPWPGADFATWFEAYLGGRWHIFDARYNAPRIGRVLVARGRDAADVALITSFGPHRLEHFRVWTDQVAAASRVAGV